MTHRVPRRRFLGTLPLAALLPRMGRAGATADPNLSDRIRGLLWAGYLGDALGGPVEFQPPEKVRALPDPPKAWADDEVLDGAALAATAARLRLRPYGPLRPEPESYGHWTADAPAGTVTDDSRHKLVLIRALATADANRGWPIGVRDLARAYLEWPDQAFIRSTPGFRELCADWLEEWQLGARWVLRQRDPAVALPPERMWNGVPTCCGQMTLPPLAALFPGRPGEAYLAAYHLAYFDNGFGRDLNAALVAGLAEALATPLDPDRPADAWARVFHAVRETDPLGHARIRWMQRPLHRWMDLAREAVDEAAGRPARLFRRLETEFARTTKWEAQVPLVVAFACIEMARYEPMAALQLALEWGHDSDSYAALLGAFIGALHGPGIFPSRWIAAVGARMKSDYDSDPESDAALLLRLSREPGRIAPP